MSDQIGDHADSRVRFVPLIASTLRKQSAHFMLYLLALILFGNTIVPLKVLQQVAITFDGLFSVLALPLVYTVFQHENQKVGL